MTEPKTCWTCCGSGKVVYVDGYPQPAFIGEKGAEKCPDCDGKGTK